MTELVGAPTNIENYSQFDKIWIPLFHPPQSNDNNDDDEVIVTKIFNNDEVIVGRNSTTR
jgi:hypothetical protein